jgi:hypothetical protein
MSNPTGTSSFSTAVYRSGCSCRVETTVGRGASFPECPRCGSETQWTFEHAQRLPEAPSSAGSPAPAYAEF